MIIVKIFQGPGNQLFQLAYGLAASSRVGVPLKLDLTWFKDNAHHRQYILDHFTVDLNIATEAEIDFVKQCDGRNFIEYRYNLLRNRWAKRHRKNVVVEDLSKFDGEILTPYKNCHVEGYFSSPLFFSDSIDLIRKNFSFRPILDPITQNYADRMAGPNTVALSVRRGDFMKYPLHNICSLEFYSRAINRLAQEFENLQVFVFSDDVEWVQNHLRLPVKFNSVRGMADYMDHMFLMSLCKIHVIPNSTFSWWGAWLSDPLRVIAPENWLNPNIDLHREAFGHWVETKHTVPDDWIRIPEFLAGETKLT
jgi:hypothetical protein